MRIFQQDQIDEIVFQYWDSLINFKDQSTSWEEYQLVCSLDGVLRDLTEDEDDDLCRIRAGF